MEADKKELKSIEEDIDKPFKYQKELDEALKQQMDINARLNIGDTDNSDIINDIEADDNAFEDETGGDEEFSLDITLKNIGSKKRVILSLRA